jgi:hypothetical protein
MSSIVDYIDSLPDAAEEVDLSSFEHIDKFDEATWKKIKGRSKMKRMKLPSALIEITGWAFGRCSQLTHVTLPSSLRSIKLSAFNGCSELEMIDLKLPASIEYLGERAFGMCERLTGKLTHFALITAQD